MRVVSAGRCHCVSREYKSYLILTLFIFMIHKIKHTLCQILAFMLMLEESKIIMYCRLMALTAAHHQRRKDCKLKLIASGTRKFVSKQTQPNCSF